MLTHKQLEMHGYVLSTVFTDALVLKHQASADQISIELDQFNTKVLHLYWTTLENEIKCETKYYIVFWGLSAPLF